MLMKGGFKRLHGLGQKSLGFTIIEVMIVLAVTGLLLYGAIVLVGGRQNITEFQQAINDVTSQLQQAINDVASGYYPNSQDFNCSNAGGPGGAVSLQAVTPGNGTVQGANADCVYLGKLIPFSSTTSSYNEYTLVGLRQPTTNGPLATGLTGADPTVLAYSVAGGQNNAPTDDYTNQPLENGLQIFKMTDANGSSIGAIAFVTNSQGNYVGGTLTSGGSQVNLYTVNPSSLTALTSTTIGNIDNNSSLFKEVVSGMGTGNVTICFVSGTTKQSGKVTIGYGSGQLEASVTTIYGDKTCT